MGTGSSWCRHTCLPALLRCAGTPFPTAITSGVGQSCCDSSTQYGFFTNAENTTTGCCGNSERGTPRSSVCRGWGGVEWGGMRVHLEGGGWAGAGRASVWRPKLRPCLLPVPLPPAPALAPAIGLCQPPRTCPPSCAACVVTCPPSRAACVVTPHNTAPPPAHPVLQTKSCVTTPAARLDSWAALRVHACAATLTQTATPLRGRHAATGSAWWLRMAILATTAAVSTPTAPPA